MVIDDSFFKNFCGVSWLATEQGRKDGMDGWKAGNKQSGSGGIKCRCKAKWMGGNKGESDANIDRSLNSNSAFNVDG